MPFGSYIMENVLFMPAATHCSTRPRYRRLNSTNGSSLPRPRSRSIIETSATSARPRYRYSTLQTRRSSSRRQPRYRYSTLQIRRSSSSR
ncbi:hypothetical protein P692DRAFT_201514892 [Suillus brevipes Sb2]|nr:hypothetical protein P692DRAFT_201514892 [Suillus brevipes Sb2]